MDLAALRRWWPLAAVLGLLFLAALAATRSEPQLERISPEADPTNDAPPLLPAEPAATVAGQTPPGAAEPATGLPDWVGTAALVVLSVAKPVGERIPACPSGSRRVLNVSAKTAYRFTSPVPVRGYRPLFST